MNALTPGSREHEMAIIAAYKEHDALEEIEASAGSDTRQLIDDRIKELCKKWPKDPVSKSKFIDAYFTVTPRIFIDLESKNLFLDEVVQKAHFGPLYDNRYGQLTNEDLDIRVECTQIIKSESVKIFDDSDTAYINSKQPIRVGLKENEIVIGCANVTIGNLAPKSMEVQIQKNPTNGLRVIIPLLFKLRGKISFDGKVTLTEKILSDGKSEPINCGKTVNLVTLFNPQNARWIHTTINANADFLP